MARRMIETDLQEEDRKIEGTLRPQKLKDYIAKSKTVFKFIYRLPSSGMMRWTMCCFMDLRVLERQHLPELLRTKWVSI